MTAARLVELERRPRRAPGSKELVHVPADRCPTCDAATAATTVTTEALFVHGGYGAARREVRRWCSALCGWSILAERTEQRPASRPGRGRP